MGLTVVTWNVKHFRRRASDAADTERVDRVVDQLRRLDPDVFALFEVTGADVFSDLVRRMPGHSISITEGQQTQETLLGVRSGLQTFTTQRLEFKGGNPALRPGALLTVVDGNVLHSMLFLHLKSFPDAAGFGIRTDQLERAFRFKAALEANAEALGFDELRYAFVGDLNTMGLDLTFSSGDIEAAAEIERLKTAASRRGMRLVDKSESATYHAPRSATTGDLDHLVVSDNTEVITATAGATPVDVIGWPQEPDEDAKRVWVRDLSDHALLRFELATVGDLGRSGDAIDLRIDAPTPVGP